MALIGGGTSVIAFEAGPQITNGALRFKMPAGMPVLTQRHHGNLSFLKRQMTDNPELLRTGQFASIIGNWIVEDIGGRGVIDNARTTIGFVGEGRVSGSGGCNRFRGPAKIEARSVLIGPLAATKKACAPALMDQEGKFFSALEAARSYKFDGAFLGFFGEDGAELLRLTRTEDDKPPL